jgi:PAS domain S-box-containing protein
MSRVSGRAFRLLLEGLETSGVKVSRPSASTSISQFVPWETFAAAVEEGARALGGPVALKGVGEAVVRAPSYRFLRSVAGHVLSASQLIDVAVKWSSPALFPDLGISAEKRANETIVRIALSRSEAPCVPFFHLSAGVLGALPTLLRLPRAAVTVETDGIEGTVRIAASRDLGRRRTLFRRLRGLVIGDPLLDELALQHEEITKTFRRLLESRQEFRDVLSRAPMVIGIHREGRFLWANAAAARTLGVARAEDLVGLEVLSFVHPDERETIARRLGAPAEATTAGEFRVVRRDGTVVVCDFAATQAVEFEGSPARMLVAADVTDRVRAREQLALADRMASLGTLAASVAHEINNPLTYVQLNLQSIARDIERGDRVSVESATSMALEGVGRVRSIVADLRTFARADEESVGPVDLVDVVESTMRLAGKTIEATSRFERALAPIPRVRGNRARLGQVVLALVLNAHEAVEERGGAGGIVRIATSCDDAHATLEIADNGVGIAPHDLSRVMEPFFTTKPVGQGTGLGLAICHRIVSAFGGTIAIDSDPSREGFRTFVRVSLPIDHEAEAAEPSSMPLSTSRRRILVIDDEPQLGRALERLLAEEHDVELVTGGQAALDRLAHGDHVDLVLCDLMMPDVDGIEVFERTHARNPDLARRFVFMSGGAFTPRSRAFMAACKNPRVDKPFTADAVRTLLLRRL